MPGEITPTRDARAAHARRRPRLRELAERLGIPAFHVLVRADALRGGAVPLGCGALPCVAREEGAELGAVAREGLAEHARPATLERDEGKAVLVWDAASGAVAVQLKHPGILVSVEWLAFDLDGRLLATRAASAKEVRLWDVGYGREAAVLAHPWMVESAALSPDRRHLATACFDGQARLWDVRGRLLALFPEDTTDVASRSDVAFSGDGTRIATGSDDGTVLVWELRAA